MCLGGMGGMVRGTGSDGKGIYRGFGEISVMRGGDWLCLWGEGCFVRGTGSDGKGIYRGFGGGWWIVRGTGSDGKGIYCVWGEFLGGIEA